MNPFIEQAVKSALRVVTKEPTRFRLDCVLLQPTGPGTIVGATDGKRVYLSHPFPYLKAENRKLIHRADSNGLASPESAPGVTGDYPDLLKYLPASFAATATISCKEVSRLRKALTRISKETRSKNQEITKKYEGLNKEWHAFKGPLKERTILWEKMKAMKNVSPMVLLQVDPTTMLLEAPVDILGGDEISCKSSEVFRIGINSNYLLDALVGVREDVTFGFNRSEEPLVLTHSLGRHIIMPMGI